MKSVLFVCLGNICRSPMAHGIFRDKVEKHGLSIKVDSAGTSGYHNGQPADSRAISTLRAKGIDILDLRSRLFLKSDFDKYDHIYTMDESNQNDLVQICKTQNSSNYPKMVMNIAFPNENISVPDPYYGGDYGFEEVYTMLDNTLEELVQRFKKDETY